MDNPTFDNPIFEILDSLNETLKLLVDYKKSGKILCVNSEKFDEIILAISNRILELTKYGER